MMAAQVESSAAPNPSPKRADKCPTTEVYKALQVAYEHFNRELFAGELPPCLITLQRSKRCRAYYSPDRFAKGDKRRGSVEYTDEIAMNPLYFGMRTPLETLSTLVHEMVHHWQRRLGTPTRRAYHDREWSNKMLGVGLQPSHTGLPGGKITGQKMSHFIVPDGAFHRVATALLESTWALEWYDRFPSVEAVQSSLATRFAPVASPKTEGVQASTEPSNTPATSGLLPPPTQDPSATPEPAIEPRAPVYDRSHRLKYTCAGCNSKVWGKAGLRLLCVGCDREFEPPQGASAAKDAQ